MCSPSEALQECQARAASLADENKEQQRQQEDLARQHKRDQALLSDTVVRLQAELESERRSARKRACSVVREEVGSARALTDQLQHMHQQYSDLKDIYEAEHQTRLAHRRTIRDLEQLLLEAGREADNGPGGAPSARGARAEARAEARDGEKIQELEGEVAALREDLASYQSEVLELQEHISALHASEEEQAAVIEELKKKVSTCFSEHDKLLELCRVYMRKKKLTWDLLCDCLCRLKA